jgi:hypothetical protein
MTIDQQCAAALTRLAQFTNRSAGQHSRAIRESFQGVGMSIQEAAVLRAVFAIAAIPNMDEGVHVSLLDAQRHHHPKGDDAEKILTVAADKMQRLVEREIEEDGDPRQLYASTL